MTAAHIARIKTLETELEAARQEIERLRSGTSAPTETRPENPYRKPLPDAPEAFRAAFPREQNGVLLTIHALYQCKDELTAADLAEQISALTARAAQNWIYRAGRALPPDGIVALGHPRRYALSAEARDFVTKELAAAKKDGAPIIGQRTNQAA